jgi:hypothetical protein
VRIVVHPTSKSEVVLLLYGLKETLTGLSPDGVLISIDRDCVNLVGTVIIDIEWANTYTGIGTIDLLCDRYSLLGKARDRRPRLELHLLFLL